MDRLLGATTLLAATGLLALGALTHALEPRPIDLDQVPHREGHRVCVEARLTHLRLTSGGTTRLLLEDGNHSLPVWAGFPWAATPGDAVRACGVLERRGHVLELRPDRPDDLAVSRAWDADAVPLADLAARPWDRLGEHVLVWGRPARDGPRTVLEDAHGGARLILRGGASLPEAAWLGIEGLVEYDAGDASFRFRVLGHRWAPGDAP